MLNTLSIRNFRGFRQFEMHDLGRVNLLVGTNNSGKTSVLEAIELLCARGDIRTLWSAAYRRGERLWDDTDFPRPEVDVCHLFQGHQIGAGSSFSIEAIENGMQERLKASICEREQEGSLFDAESSADWEPDSSESFAELFDLELEWGGTFQSAIRVPLSAQGGLSRDASRRYYRSTEDYKRNIHFVATDSLTSAEVVAFFDEIVLTREEASVTETLQIIDPTIERIATSTTRSRRSANSTGRGGIVVKCKGIEQRIPIGTMGDGIWRMLSLALALTTAENGVLLVDEIDTGLHFTVMVDMWKMVAQSAKRLGVQVFATTHSRDCYESLAAIAHENVAEASEVTIQRIEREKDRAVAYTEREIVAAAERGIEVR